MKIKQFTGVLLFAGLTACSANQTESATKGAATGAVSASLVGALTDLVIDGQVNTDRLQRNMVAGAIAGGATGAVVGTELDKREEAASQQDAATPAEQPAPEKEDESDAKLKEKIGDDNYQGLVFLMQCQHEQAYRESLKGASDPAYQEASIALQALIDRDRRNTEGEQRAIEQFMTVAEPEMSAVQLEAEIDKLQQQLQQERQVQGRSPDC